jgi:hypothetical protein
MIVTIAIQVECPKIVELWMQGPVDIAGWYLL